MNEQDLSPEAAALLEAERHWPGPPAPVQERLLARIFTTVAAGPFPGPNGNGGGDAPASGAPPVPTPIVGGGGAAAGASALQAAGTGASALLKPGLMVAFLVGTAVGTGATLLVQRASAPAVQILHQPATTAPTVGATAAPTLTAPATGPQTTSLAPTGRPAVVVVTPVRRTKTRRPAPAPESLAAERRLVELARAALARGRAGDALQALEQHRARFPAGQLAEEREGLAVLTRAAAGDDSAARAAEEFRRRYPRSLLLPAIEAALARTGDE
jgi:hypothetical protein